MTKTPLTPSSSDVAENAALQYQKTIYDGIDRLSLQLQELNSQVSWQRRRHIENSPSNRFIAIPNSAIKSTFPAARWFVFSENKVYKLQSMRSAWKPHS
jgi:hypothetical protein